MQKEIDNNLIENLRKKKAKILSQNLQKMGINVELCSFYYCRKDKLYYAVDTKFNQIFTITKETYDALGDE